MVETKTIIFWKHNSQLFRDQILFPMYELDDCFVVSTRKQTNIYREREEEKGEGRKRRKNHTVSFFCFFGEKINLEIF